MVYVYPVVFSPESGGGFCVYAPDFPGCVTDAEGYAEGIEKIRDGMGGMLHILTRDKKPLPGPSDPARLEHEPGDVVSLVDVDLTAYERKASTNAVRRTVSIPEWMDAKVIDEGLSLSRVLQDALSQRFE